MNGENILETLQADVMAILALCPDLADVALLAQDAGDTESDVLRKLGPLNAGETGKRGLVIVVMLPEVDASEPNLPGPPLDITIELQVIEHPKINRGTSGTGIRSSVAALRTLSALHLRGLGKVMLMGSKEAVRPLQVKPGFISHALKLEVPYRGISPAARCAPVTAAFDSGTDTLTLTCATPGSTIYLTFDESTPGPSNPDGFIYNSPEVGISVGTVVRAMAVHATISPSDILELTVTA